MNIASTALKYTNMPTCSHTFFFTEGECQSKTNNCNGNVKQQLAWSWWSCNGVYWSYYCDTWGVAPRHTNAGRRFFSVLQRGDNEKLETPLFTQLHKHTSEFHFGGVAPSTNDKRTNAAMVVPCATICDHRCVRKRASTCGAGALCRRITIWFLEQYVALLPKYDASFWLT